MFDDSDVCIFILGDALWTKQGWTPSEMLCQKLNAFLTKLIEVTDLHGGDVIGFSGDAITILFAVEAPQADGKSCESNHFLSPDRRAATLRAAQCALAIHKSTQEFAPELTVHMGLGAGCFTGIFVGGAFGRKEYILAGDPMKQISIAEPIAVSGVNVPMLICCYSCYS